MTCSIYVFTFAFGLTDQAMGFTGVENLARRKRFLYAVRQLRNQDIGTSPSLILQFLITPFLSVDESNV
jgi:hypothetical protein